MDELRIHTLLERAKEFSNDGKPLHAAQLYRRLQAEAPGLVEPYLLLAALYAEQGLRTDARQTLCSALLSHPGHPSLVMMLGDLCVRDRLYAEAVSWYVSLRPRRIAEVYVRLGTVYSLMGALRQAETEFRAALGRDRRSPKIHEMLGEVLLRRELPAAALEELRRAVALEPYSAAAHRLLGLALLQLHRPAEALEELILAVDMDPDDATAWRLCGEILTKLRRFEEAEFYANRARALDPDSPDAAATVGFLCLHRGDPAAALRAFESALKIQPGHRRALDGRLHAKLLTDQAWTKHESGAPGLS